MISIGRKMHCPSACTAGTVFANIAMTIPRPRKAIATAVNASHSSTGCLGSGMPSAMASANCNNAASTSSAYLATSVLATI